MFSCKIKEIREFMNKLLVKSDFDGFAVSDAVILTYNSFVIDGHLRREHFSDEEWEDFNGRRFSEWETIRPFCFQAVRGKKVPESFKIVLLLGEEDKQELFNGSDDINIKASDINGLYLNIKYESGELTLTTGTSLKIFTIDKTVDNIWEAYIKDFLLKKEIEFEPLH